MNSGRFGDNVIGKSRFFGVDYDMQSVEEVLLCCSGRGASGEGYQETGDVVRVVCKDISAQSSFFYSVRM